MDNNPLSNLTEDEIAEIQELGKHHSYPSLVKLLRAYRHVATLGAVQWTDVNDAHQKRGYLQAVENIIETLDKIHSTNTNRNEPDPRQSVIFGTQRRAQQSVPNGPDIDEFFDTPATKPSY